MKRIAVLAIALGFLFSCGGHIDREHLAISDASSLLQEQQKMIDDMKLQIQELQKEVAAQRTGAAQTLSVPYDPKLFFQQLDQCIEELGTNKEMDGECGSFSDWVEPGIAKARQAGASKKDITTRLDQILRLAKQKKYFSGFLADVDDQGPGHLEKLFADIKKGIK